MQKATDQLGMMRAVHSSPARSLRQGVSLSGANTRRSPCTRSSGASPEPAAPRVSVVIPTWNEHENIALLLDAIRRELSGVPFEVVVVDDASSDGTPAAVLGVAHCHANVRLVQRPGKMGLSSAVMHGTAHAAGGIVVMMDADFSHDPAVLPMLIEKIEGGYEVAVGSRYIPGGRVEGWPLHRRIGSALFTQLARTIFRLQVRDPLSGFAAYRREVLEDVPTRFSAEGFKLLLEVVVTRSSLRVTEVPITFTDRTRGTSKLAAGEISGFLTLCYQLLRWRSRRRRVGRRASGSPDGNGTPISL